MKRYLSILIGFLFLASLSQPAAARIDKKVTYTESVVWRCAIRFIRVDQHFKIIEKDKDSGYLLFEYTEEGRMYHGSLEIMPMVEQNLRYVRVKIRIEDQPSYVESLLYNKFHKKLRSEYGDAPPAKLNELPKPKVTEPEDKGDDNDKSLDKDDAASEEDLEITEDDLNDSNEE